jgi:hypothetical protein
MNLSTRFDERTRKIFAELRDKHNGDAVAVISNALDWYHWLALPARAKPVNVESVNTRNSTTDDKKRDYNKYNWSGYVIVSPEFAQGIRTWSREHKVSLRKLSVIVGYKRSDGLYDLFHRVRQGKAQTSIGIVEKLESITGLKNDPKQHRICTEKNLGAQLVNVSPEFKQGVRKWAKDHNVSLSRLAITAGYKSGTGSNILMRNGRKRTRPSVIKRLESITGLENRSNGR